MTKILQDDTSASLIMKMLNKNILLITIILIYLSSKLTESYNEKLIQLTISGLKLPTFHIEKKRLSKQRDVIEFVKKVIHKLLGRSTEEEMINLKEIVNHARKN